MAMAKGLCVDGPKAGSVVWLGDDASRWVVSGGLRGYVHYAAAGHTQHEQHGDVLVLSFAGRSRSRVELPKQQTVLGSEALAAARRMIPNVPAVPEPRTAG